MGLPRLGSLALSPHLCLRPDLREVPFHGLCGEVPSPAGRAPCALEGTVHHQVHARRGREAQGEGLVFLPAPFLAPPRTPSDTVPWPT